MPVTIVVGLGYGDEGKGRVVHAIAGDYDLVARVSGGANAAHTVIHDGLKHTLRQVPCGVFHSRATSLTGLGMVIDPFDLTAELAALAAGGVDTAGVRLAHTAHVVLPWHIELETAREESRGRDAIGTTRRGVGQALVDKMTRGGVRVADLYDATVLKARLTALADEKAAALGRRPSVPALVKKLQAAARALEHRVVDGGALVQQLLRDGRAILVEGAQGALLDVDHGAYPYVTASHPTTGGALAALGAPPQSVDRVVGVTRCYQTRQSLGPFPTELPAVEERVFRATTRDHVVRVGWLDAPALARSAAQNGCTELVVTGLDRTAGLPRVRVAVSATTRGPVYEDIPGPAEDAGPWTRYQDLPSRARALVDMIEARVAVPVRRVSAGRSGALLKRTPARGIRTWW